MFILYFLASLVLFIRTISYGIFEYKQKENKTGAYLVFFIATLGFVSSNILFFRYTSF